MLGSEDSIHWLHTNTSVLGADFQVLAEVGLKGEGSVRRGQGCLMLDTDGSSRQWTHCKTQLSPKLVVSLVKTYKRKGKNSRQAEEGRGVVGWCRKKWKRKRKKK